MPVDLLRKNYFWNSWFEASGNNRVWVSRVSATLAIASAVAGVSFLAFIFLTVGAAVTVSQLAIRSGINYVYLFFLAWYIILLALTSFLFFKDIFLRIRFGYDGEFFSVEQPVFVDVYVPLLFFRKKIVFRDKLVSIWYTPAVYEFLYDDSEYLYRMEFVFESGFSVKYPIVSTTPDIIRYFVGEGQASGFARFGHFTKKEVQRIASFFGVSAFEKN